MYQPSGFRACRIDLENGGRARSFPGFFDSLHDEENLERLHDEIAAPHLSFEVRNDAEGAGTMEVPGRNMAWLLEKIHT
jgi:hypothetical protein